MYIQLFHLNDKSTTVCQRNNFKWHFTKKLKEKKARKQRFFKKIKSRKAFQ